MNLSDDQDNSVSIQNVTFIINKEILERFCIISI